MLQYVLFQEWLTRALTSDIELPMGRKKCFSISRALSAGSSRQCFDSVAIDYHENVADLNFWVSVLVSG